MRATLLTTVATAVLSLGAMTAMAQTSSSGSGTSDKPGRSEMAPGQTKPPATSSNPARSESAPGQNRPTEATNASGQSERAPGQARDAGSTASFGTGSRAGQAGAEGDKAAPSTALGDRGSTGEQSGSSNRATAAGSQPGQQPPAAAARQGSSQTSSSTNPQGSRSGKTSTMQQGHAGSNQSGTATESGPSQSSAASQSRDTTTTGAISGTSNLNREQRTQVTQAFASTNVQSVNNVNFSVSVGSTVTDNLRLYDVPADVVRLVPQYRGYRYFAVRDEIVIVEPRTKKIVEVIQKSGGPRTSASLNLSTEKRQLLKRNVSNPGSSSTVTRAEVTEGAILPRDIELLDVPQTVVSEVPELRSYRYIVVGDEVAVVEPQTRRIIEVFE